MKDMSKKQWTRAGNSSPAVWFYVGWGLLLSCLIAVFLAVNIFPYPGGAGFYFMYSSLAGIVGLISAFKLRSKILVLVSIIVGLSYEIAVFILGVNS